MRDWRQQDIVDGARLGETPVTVIGAGATGSFITLALAKMGVRRLTVYDDDTVEEHNLPNQFYRLRDLGRPKVEALGEVVYDYAGITPTLRAERYVDQSLSGLVIVCVDSMDARLAIWRQVRYQAAIPLFIDTRMGAEVAVVHTIRPLDPDDVGAYEDTLHSSAEALPVRCTEKAVIYTALGIASLACGKVKKYVMGQPMNRTLVRDYRLSLLQ